MLLTETNRNLTELMALLQIKGHDCYVLNLLKDGPDFVAVLYFQHYRDYADYQFARGRKPITIDEFFRHRPPQRTEAPGYTLEGRADG